MSQQTSLRWKDNTLDEVFEQLPEEHRRRAQRLFAHLIARAARGPMTDQDCTRRAGRGGLVAVAGGERGAAEQALGGAGRCGLPLLVFEEGGSDLALRAQAEVALKLERSGPVFDQAAPQSAGHKGANR